MRIWDFFFVLVGVIVMFLTVLLLWRDTNTKALIGCLLTIVEVQFVIIADTGAVAEGYMLILRQRGGETGAGMGF